jgi:hypothetical protein
VKSKEELIQEYQSRKPIAGVFRIKNLVSNKMLLEASSDMPSKMNRHRTELKFGTHRNRSLQEDWNTNGEENFDISIISQVPFKEGDNQLYLNLDANMMLDILEKKLRLEDEMRY